MKLSPDSLDKEIGIEKKLRKFRLVIPLTTLITASLLLWGIYTLMKLFEQGHYWTSIPAGVLAQSFLIICLHDGTHKSITKTWLDRLIANLSAALLFMPFGELYRKYHLIHHRNTNLKDDPISPPSLRKLFVKNRYYYILCECLPLLYTFYLVMSYQKSENGNTKPEGINISLFYLACSIVVSVLWFVLVDPSVVFIFLTMIVFNLVTVVRNWCEHMGTETNKKSNTYWFPLGFGIGHHDLHHQKPYLSWLTLTLGLPYHKKDTNPIRAVNGILFDKTFSFYSKH